MLLAGLYKKMLVGAVITLIAVASYPHLPQRHLQILPSNAVVQYLSADKAKGGGSQVNWINEAQHHIICDVKPSKISPYCGMQIKLADGQGRGRDLSHFNTVTLKIYYKGSGNMLRFHLRNFDPRFSKVGNSQSDKFQSYSIYTSETNHLLTIPLNAIAVADWWLEEYAIKREYAAVDISNVTYVGVDIPSPIDEGEHEIRLDQLEFIGPWVSTAYWYGGIVALWGMALPLLLIWNQRSLSQRMAIDRSRLTDFKEMYGRLAAAGNMALNQHYDHVTHLLDRNGLAVNLWQLRQDTNLPTIVLAIVDMDNFSEINAKLGHELGNELLRAIGGRLAELIGRNGLVSRWGDDKFVVVLTGEAADNRVAFLQNLRLAIGHTPFMLGGESLQLTASIAAQEWRVSLPPVALIEALLQEISRLKRRGGNFFVEKKWR